MKRKLIVCISIVFVVVGCSAESIPKTTSEIENETTIISYTDKTSQMLEETSNYTEFATSSQRLEENCLQDGSYYIHWDPTFYESNSEIIVADVYEYMLISEMDDSESDYYHSVNGYVLDDTDQVVLKNIWGEADYPDCLIPVSSDVVICEGTSGYYYIADDQNNVNNCLAYDTLDEYVDYWNEYARIYEDWETHEIKKSTPGIHIEIKDGKAVLIFINPNAHQDWRDPEKIQ